MTLAAKEFTVRLGQVEISRLLNLKETVEHNGLWLRRVARYQSLGWFLEAMNAGDNSLLEVDFFQPRETWAKRLADLGMEGIQVNVGIRTGRASRCWFWRSTRVRARFPWTIWGSGGRIAWQPWGISGSSIIMSCRWSVRRRLPASWPPRC